MKNIYPTLIGWFGACLVLGAYAALSAKKIRSNSKLYVFLNVFGALCLMFNAYHVRYFPSVVTNGFWIFMGLYGFSKVKKNRKAMMRLINRKRLVKKYIHRF